MVNINGDIVSKEHLYISATMVSIPLFLSLFCENTASFSSVYDMPPSSMSSNTLPLSIPLGWWLCC